MDDDPSRYTDAQAGLKPALEFDPYVFGGTLLARQAFRHLFRSERVDEKEGLGIRQVTFLFTDLKSSTAMYERLGDLNAYALSGSISRCSTRPRRGIPAPS